MDKIKLLRQRLAGLVDEAEGLSAKDVEGNINAEETARYKALLDTEIPAAQAAVAREEQMMEARRLLPQEADTTAAAGATGGAAVGTNLILPGQGARVPAQVAGEEPRF